LWFKGLQARGYAVAAGAVQRRLCGKDFCELNDGSGSTPEIQTIPAADQRHQAKFGQNRPFAWRFQFAA